MPVGIVQVMNNTSYMLYYNNLESGYTFHIPPKTQQYENDRLIPSSKFYDDTLPWYNSNRPDKHIEIKINDVIAKISEKHAKFNIITPVDDLQEGQYGSMYNG